MPISRKLALTEQEVNQILTDEWNCRIATIGPGDQINLTPMWFGWVQKKIYIYGRGQKIVNLRRNGSCTVLVDRNEKFPELQAVMFRGTGQILETVAEEQEETDLLAARIQMGIKYNGGHGNKPVNDPPPNSATVRGKTGRWIVFHPGISVTWDNFKLTK